MPNAILDPTGRAPAAAPSVTFAARPEELRGAMVGLLENTKQNAALFLAELGRLLVDRYGAAAVVPRTKRVFAQPVPEEQLAELSAACDVLVTGVGDCGSCSASAVADGVAFEGRGVPAAIICSDAFTASTDAMARLRGVPGYRYVTTPHPVAVLTPEEVRDRAERALPDVVALLTAGGDG